MKAVSANLLALLFLCTCASVLYVWDTLENRVERSKRGERRSSRPGPSATDTSTKTFRALLAVPGAHRLLRMGIGGPEVRNLTRERDRPGSLQSPDYHVNGDNKGSGQKGGQAGSGSPSPVEDGIFWSAWLEERLPTGFPEENARSWREGARGQPVVKLEPGCGRISNQLATFSDGSRACVRYGINADQVQGETLTYYLAGLLGISNLPPLVLAQLGGGGGGGGGGGTEQWAAVRPRIAALQWGDRAVVSLTEWVANLTGAVTPAPLRQQGSGLHPHRADLRNKSTGELLELMQWTDLIALDYLTANFDRLVSNLHSLQWDARVMERDTNNLLKTPRGDLVFIDNEAGLVHGYRVLDMWEKYHDAVLGSVCVFRRRTARRVAELAGRRDTAAALLERYRDNEPLSAVLGFLSDEHAGVLQGRIDRLYTHIGHCKGKYSQLQPV